MGPNQILADLGRDFVLRSEFQALKEHLDGMQTLMEQGGKDADPNAPG